jgi:hypothetical protein
MERYYQFRWVLLPEYKTNTCIGGNCCGQVTHCQVFLGNKIDRNFVIKMELTDNDIIYSYENDFFGPGLTAHFLSAGEPYSIMPKVDFEGASNLDELDFIDFLKIFEAMPAAYFPQWPHHAPNTQTYGDRIILSAREAEYFTSINGIKEFVTLTGKKKNFSAEDEQYIIGSKDDQYMVDCLLYSETDEKALKHLMEYMDSKKKGD